MKYIDQLELKGKKVFIRSDLNVPFDKSGAIADDNRIRASLPTIEYALKNGAKVIVTSHLGRPEGRDMKYSLKPVAERLQQLLKTDVVLAPDCVGPEVKEIVSKMDGSKIVMLENVRFHDAEEQNDEAFAKELASLADVYVNDAFATAHRKHASTAGIAKFMSEKAGGFTLKDEISYFQKAFENPERPFVAIFGGAKVSTKMAAIKNAGQRADTIIIGGAMANTFFVAHGLNVGKSLYEPEQVEAAKEAEAALKAKGCKILLPVDVVVATEMKGGVQTKAISTDKISPDELALDVGPKTNQLFNEALKSAKTVIWNGPMGAFEIEEFSSGTFNIVDTLAASTALTVVGGGDTDLALHQRHAFDKMSYVSTAGGAFLKLLEGGTLAAVKALES